EAHNNLGSTLQELGKLSEAEASLRQAIALKPDYVEAHYNLGNALKQLHRLDEAEASYRQAIALKFDYAEAHINLGVVLQELNMCDDAEASLRQAIALKPDFAELRYNLGNVLKQLGRLDEAEANYRQAIALGLDVKEVHYNLGNTLQQQGRLDEAEASLRQAIALKPDYAEAHSNLGATLKELGRLDDAELTYVKAIALKSGAIVASRNILNLPVGQLDPKTLEWCEKRFPTLGKSAGEEAKSAFFRAKLLKHRGLIDQSFSEFCKANEIKLENMQNEIALESESNTQSLNRIRDWVPKPPAAVDPSLVKLFIMGPSKSGKSLMEHILCKSPQVKPLFEAVQYSGLENAEIKKSYLPGSLFDSIFFHSEDELLNRGYEVVTSTNPLSIFKADYLLDMVPNSYFLVINRDIQDLSAEIFTEEYISGNYYSSDINAIMTYLSVYKKICETLITKAPSRCLILNFDDIIESTEVTVGRIGELVSQYFEVDGLIEQGTKFASASIFRDHFAKILDGL
ncbi:tetratricopeptide repeat protein, partial [Luminiphilus sp.]|nr:tetratricopeptide repeat protein [Luminiphilus sp.]